jgi:hypothetical protein
MGFARALILDVKGYPGILWPKLDAMPVIY